MRRSFPERCTKEEDAPYALDRWKAEREVIALEGVNMEDWQARVAVARLVTTGMQALIEAEEAKGQLEEGDQFLDITQRYCLGERAQAFVKSGTAWTSLEVGAVVKGAEPQRWEGAGDKGGYWSADGRWVEAVGKGREWGGKRNTQRMCEGTT